MSSLAKIYLFFFLMKIFSFFLQIYPLSGPKTGGTELTIEGMNLGKAYEDIVNFVDVAMISCEPIRTKYQPPSRLVVYFIIFHNLTIFWDTYR
jgi:hypothetical protein